MTKKKPMTGKGSGTATEPDDSLMLASALLRIRGSDDEISHQSIQQHRSASLPATPSSSTASSVHVSSPPAVASASAATTSASARSPTRLKSPPMAANQDGAVSRQASSSQASLLPNIYNAVAGNPPPIQQHLQQQQQAAAAAAAFTPQQLAVLQAASAAGAASFAAAAANPTTLLGVLQSVRARASLLPPQPLAQPPTTASILHPHSTASALLRSVTGGVAGTNNSTTSPAVAAAVAQAAAAAAAASAVKPAPPAPMAPPVPSPPAAAATKQNEPLRPEKVEAALRSKPQRGRKRENLSELERQELTRTRNREHAKSTRIRKKVRYQELVDAEQRLLELQRADRLHRERRQSVVDFCAIRETMLRNSASCDTSTEESDQTAKAANVGSESSDSAAGAAEPRDLEDVVHSVAEFAFDYHGSSDRPPPPPPAAEGGGSTAAATTTSSAVARMNEFDESLRARAVNRFGPPVVPLLSYKVKGSVDGISLDLMDGGFAEAELVLSTNHDEIRLLSSLVKVRFAPGSSKLASAEWLTFKDAFDTGNFERLMNAQVSHPSVVSLDVEKQQQEENNKLGGGVDDNGPGPGMNI